jgi:WD40 repeat protein
MSRILASILFVFLSLPPSALGGSQLKLEKIFRQDIERHCPERVEFSPDGEYFLASGSSSSALVWRVSDFSFSNVGEQVDKERSICVGANFLPNSREIFIGRNNGTAIVVSLDFKTKQLHILAHHGVNMSAISHSGKILALDRCFLNTETKQLFDGGQLTSPRVGLAFTKDDRYMVTGDYWCSLVFVIDTQAARQIWSWRPQRWFSSSDINVISVDASADNDTVAVGLKNEQVWLYSIRTGKVIKRLSYGEYPSLVKFSPDGKLLLEASKRKIKLWDVSTGKEEREWKIEKISSVKWFWDLNAIAVGTQEGELILESIKDKETLFRGKVTEDATNDMTYNPIMDIDYLPSKRLILLCDYNGNVMVFKITHSGEKQS